MASGRIASSTPLCRSYGLSRGKPIDRFYIERFLGENSALIRGDVLEVGDDGYARRFGANRVGKCDLLHVDASNARATVTGDLSASGVLPESNYDCIILTQTLQYVLDVNAACSNLHQALKRGGALLLSVPGIAPGGLDPWPDYWSFRPATLEALLTALFGDSNVEVASHGNLFAATAFLHGAAVEDVSSAKLEHNDPAYPLLVTARAIR